MRKAQRAESKRIMLDTLGRCNANKRGRKPKTEHAQPKVEHKSRLQPGRTCNYSRNVITLPCGKQVLEGSLAHIQSIH